MSKQDNNHYVVRSTAPYPDDETDQEALAKYNADLEIARSLGKEMRLAGPYRSMERREDGLEILRQEYAKNRHNNVGLLCFKNDVPVGILVASASYLFSLEYILAICSFLFVRPSDRDHKAAAILMQAFKQWAERRGCDEMRFLVTSADNSEGTHKTLTGLDFVHLGGNYAYPLSDKGHQVLDDLQPSKQVRPEGKGEV